MDTDDLEPRRPPKSAHQPVDVTALSIAELHAYLDYLAGEAARARAEIEAKQSSMTAADRIFKK